MARKRKDKRMQKYVILLVAGLMLFSGLFLGLRRPQTPTQTQAEDYPIRFVDVQALQGTSEVLIEGQLNQVAAYVENPQLNADDVTRILQGNYSLVSDVELESSPAYTVFIFYTQTPDKTLESLEGELILSGGKKLYQLYLGQTKVGPAVIYGVGLTENDTVDALLYRKKEGQEYSLVGFAVTEPDDSNLGQ